MTDSSFVLVIVTADEVPKILRVLQPTAEADGTKLWLWKLEKAADRTATAVEWMFGRNVTEAVSRHRDELPGLWGQIERWKNRATEAEYVATPEKT